MVSDTKPAAEPRTPLSKERVLLAAIEIADAEGIAALTMRHLAESLGVEAMSLYYHVRNKEAVLDGIVDSLVGEIEEELGGFDVPEPKSEWKANLRRRILAARKVMLRHKWAPTVFETRTTMSPRLIHYFDTLLGIMIEGGVSYDLGHHAMHALGSRALGFSQELFQPDPGSAEEADTSEMLETMAAQIPFMVGMLEAVSHDGPDETLGWCDDQTEFEFALDVLLDGFEARAAAEA